jgi:hypothetical protein
MQRGDEMISVKVTYTVKPEFVPKNLENIKSFLNDFRKIKEREFRYTVYLCDDGKTFLHRSSYANEEVQKHVLTVESFKSFQKERDESGLEGSHRIEEMQLIGSSHGIFA